RELLRSKGIKAVIPEKSDQVANRKNKGSAGGRPPNFDAESYKGRNVVERAFNKAKQWRAVATRYDKLALTYRAGFLRRHRRMAQTIGRHALVSEILSIPVDE
ncbi:hypothetical protein ACFQ70_22720, partial [Rhodococcus koreensis]